MGAKRFAEQLKTLAETIENRSNLVDEYNTAAVTGAGSSSVVTVQPTYEYMPEKIESVLITGPGGPLASINNTGITATGPPAGALVTSVTLQPGTYTINWLVQLGGTTAAIDASNHQLMLNGTQIATSVNASTTGTVSAQTPVTVVVTQPNSTLSINVGPATPTGTAVYRGQLAAANVSGNNVTLQLGDRIWQLAIPATGYLQLGYVGLILGRSDARILTPATPGVYTLELMGIADRRFNI